MHLWQFFATQGILFGLLVLSYNIAGGGESFLDDLVVNSITFIPASYLFTLFWRKKFSPSSIWSFVLSVNLCFNLVVYLLYYAYSIPMPGGAIILQDFVLVAFLSAIGVLIGLKTSKPTSH